MSQPFDRLDSYANSVGLWTREVSARLARSEQVTVYAPGRRPCGGLEDLDGLSYRTIDIRVDDRIVRSYQRLRRLTKLGPLSFNWAAYCLGYAMRASRHMRSLKVDVAHVHFFSQFAPIIRLMNPRTKIVLHMQCEYLSDQDLARASRRLRSVDAVLGCSDFITDRIRNRYPRQDVRTVYNGIDPDHLRRIPGDPAKSSEIVFVGRVSPEKGVHILLEAFRLVLERFPEACLRIIGGHRQLPTELAIDVTRDPMTKALSSFYTQGSLSQYYGYLQDRVRSLGIQDRVIFHGKLPHSDVMPYLASCRLLVVPSVWDEPFGIPLIEAMGCSKPVVATSGGGIPEVVQNGITGLLVQRRDVERLAEGMLRILEDEALARAMGEAGRLRAESLFSWDRIADEVLQIYRDLVSGLSREGSKKR